MGIADKYNKGGVNWMINTEGFEFRHLSTVVEGSEIPVKGLYINNKSKFGPSPVLIAPDCFYNLPGYLAGTVQQMIQDPDLIAAVKAGKVVAVVRKFTDSTYNRESWTVDWKDVP